jgi:hypothetical protein
MTSTQLKTQINADVTNKTANNSITPTILGNNLEDIVDYIDQQDGVVPKRYRALITQTGTAAPVATVLENTLGGTLVWTRVGAGAYRATLTGAFPIAKYFAPMPMDGFDVDANAGGGGSAYHYYRGTDNYVDLLVGADSQLINSPVEITVYN